MHKYQLKTLLNFSGHGWQLIARRCLLSLFLWLAGVVSADCVNSIYPKSIATDLLADAEGVLSLRKAEAISTSQEGAELCSIQAQDLAQLYFWGAQTVTPAVTPNLKKSYQYGLQSKAAGHWPYELRLLRAAYVLAGLDNSYSPDEALRQFLREIVSGEPLRRDKATAVLNQLSYLRPYIKLSAGKVYSDSSLAGLMTDIENAVLLSQTKNRLRLLVLDQHGLPQLAWARSSEVRQAEVNKTAKHRLFLQRLPPHGANGAQDSRQQVWQLPKSVPHTGILISRFRQTDGSLYESRCTANPISEEWLISAAHCLFAPDGSQNVVSLGYVAKPLTEAGVRQIRSAWFHKLHDPADQIAGNVGRYSGSDIALLQLSDPLVLADSPKLAIPQHHARPNWFDSFAYPSDKAPNTLWHSRCRANLWQSGESLLGDLYGLDCLSYDGQSGAALLQNLAGEVSIVGILSSRIHNKKINQPIFTAFNSALIDDIGLVIAGDTNKPLHFRPFVNQQNLAEVKSEFLP
jgi:V8-like Glu-specific endopeptidase